MHEDGRPRRRDQVRALFFILLLAGQEAQAIANATGAGNADDSSDAMGQALGAANGSSQAPPSALFAQPDSAVIHLATERGGGSHPRSLAISLGADWQWPTGSQLEFISTRTSGEDVPTAGIEEVKVCAALKYKKIVIKTAGTTIGTAHHTPMVKLVSGSADRTKCRTTAFDMPVGIAELQSGAVAGAQTTLKGRMGKSGGPLQLNNAADELSVGNVNIVFMHGGQFKLCYTPDGSFGGNDGSEVNENIVNTMIKVFGVYSDCIDYDGCLRDERWECSFGYKGESVDNCEFSFKFDGGRIGWGIEVGERSRITWSAAYGPDTLDGSGQIATPEPKYCADDHADTAFFDLGSQSVYMDIDEVSSALMPPVKGSHSTAFTLAACYCPNYNAERGTHCGTADVNECCDSHVEYIQPVGLVYYWTIRICDYSHFATCNANPPSSYRYMRVIPQQKFVVRIDCPPGGGCLATDENRIKFIADVPANDRPSWDVNAGCRTFVTESIFAVWPSSTDSRAISGGRRLDYKAWRGKQVKINLSLNRVMDLCFANSDPGTADSWFKVGSVMTTRAFAFASKTGAGSTYQSIKYVGYAGSVTLMGGIMSQGAIPTPYDSNMYSGKALVNVMSFDREKNFGVGQAQTTLEQQFSYNLNTPIAFQTQMDTECQRESYSPTLITGPSSKQAAKNYIGRVDVNSDNTVSHYQTFSGDGKDNMMTIKQAGVVAICYCGMVSPQDECQSSAWWIYAGRITIQGPQGGKSFTLPTEVVIKFDLMGWGFGSSDELRIVDATSECDSNANNPPSYLGFKVNCPAQNGLGCRQATTTERIQASVETAQSAGVYIEAVDVFQTSSVLKFSGPIDTFLGSDPDFGEDIITIDFDRIKVNDKDMTDPALTPGERYEVYKLSGEYEFQDDLTEKFQVGHRVNPYPTTGVVDKTKLSIPVGWVSQDTFPFTVSPFSFIDDQGHWTRRNRLETQEELKGTKAASNLKLCWGVYSQGTTKFYAEAGKVNFVEPDPMASAVVSFTTKQNGAVAPVIIAFKTLATRSEYATATGETQLMLRFLDVSGKLEPYYFDQQNGIRGIYEVPENKEIIKSKKMQYVCGKIFTELWSSHSEGFPMPVGCHYSKKLSDKPASGESPVFFREFFITFGELNGLRQDTEYQIVLNAEIKAKGITANQKVVDLYAMCAGFQGCARPYQVFEKGSAVASATTENTATASDPQFAPDGFLIQRGDPTDGVLDLDKLNILQVRLTGGSGLMGIVKESFIRIYMWPLTSWDVGSAPCSAECIPFHHLTKQCVGEVGCDSEEVVGGSSRRNIVKIKLPTEMDTIDETTTHTIKITGLTLPLDGFFPSKVGVQLTRPDDTRPFYTISKGMLMKAPEAGRTEGRITIADRSGYGPRPFKADNANVLYLRLKLGATLWNVGRNDAAMLTIHLPKDYGACSIEDGGIPPKDLKVFLQKTAGYVDNNRGVLAVSNDDGDWENSNIETCAYELSPNNQAIYAGMVFYVAITVNNPGQAMTKVEKKNVWKIKLSSLGAYDPPQGIDQWQPKDMPLVPFISLAEEVVLGQEFWAGNAAVINKLEQEVVQPASFVRSCCGPNFDTRRSEEFLRVFFATTTHAGQNGYVVFDSPMGFDFGQSCTARDLPERYYAFVGEQANRLFKLKSMGACTGSRYPSTAPTYNRATLQVGGIIDEKLIYGFEIRVTHPTTYSTSQHFDWYLWTQDSNGYALEGSENTIRFNKFQADKGEFWHKSWGMYDQEAVDFPVLLVDNRPKSSTKEDTQVIFYPITFPVDIDTSLRISAPLGFVWDTDANNFFRTTNNSVEDFPKLPTYENNNQLVWDAISFKGSVQYGFRASVSVPDHNPVESSNSFFIEFGFRETSIFKRLYANVAEATSIAAVTNAEVTFATNLLNYQDNRVEFALQIVTPLTDGCGIIIQGNDKTKDFEFTCTDPLNVLPESDPLPSDVLCDAEPSTDSTPKISLKVNKNHIKPGYYKFEMLAKNPAVLKLEPGAWTFGTWTNVRQYPGPPPLDKALDAVGFKIDDRMPEARLTSLAQDIRQKTNRNDRPGKANQLIFQFRLRARPQSDRIMTLRGPRGFLFHDNCLPYLITEKNNVFGPNTADTFPPDYTEWPDQFRPTKCIGKGREALISIPIGLGRNNLFAFRIAIKSNPMETPAWNKWSINYNDESSEPFMGFTIWTNTNMVVTPVGTMKSQLGAAVDRTEIPVTFQFTPFNRIPWKPPGEVDKGGLLRLIAPVGFEFVHSNSECEVNLMLTDGSIVFDKSDYICQVENKVRLLLWMAAEKDIRDGFAYSLTVFVYHPPSSSIASFWEMDSFSQWTAEPDTALDESTVLGYKINNVLNIFEVKNTNNIPNGNTKINDIDILLQFPDPLKDGDDILITGPKGFNLIGNPELQNCNEFRWVGSNPLPVTGDPGCTCDTQQYCTIRFPIDESRDPAYPQNMDIHFKVASKNPPKTPFLMDNYWKVEHMKGSVIQSSHVVQGWSINPQLENVDVLLVGANLAARKTSDIELKFTPVTNAETVKVEAIFPTQFNFDQSTVALPYDISSASEGSTIIIDRGGFKAGTPVSIRINSVRLGRAGGQTRFNIVTYSDDKMLEKKDEKLDFKKGFRLPGLITVLGKPQLKSKFQDAKAMFPVKSLFQPRVLEEAKAEFTLSFSRQVQASERLIITCQGQGAYALQASPFVIIGMGQIETSVELDSNGAIKATLKPGRPATEVALQADMSYTVIMWVLPVKGTNTWRFDTIDGAVLPSNTNDGETDGFSPVEQMMLGVEAVRSPPKAIVDVVLNIDPGSAIVRELIIIAPPSFLFDESAGGCGDMCMPGEALSSTSRKTATIASPTGEPLTQLKGLKIRVMTPEQTPSSVTWYVEGRGQGAGTTTGWGEGPGFFVVQMGGTTVTYPAVAGVVDAQIAFTFALDVNAGNQISVVAPPGFLLTCSAEGSLKKISLPGGKPDCIDEPLLIRLDATLTSGQYAFALKVDLPPETPSVNTFSLIIRDQDNNVVDAAYSIQGMPIVNIWVSDPTLAWSKAEPGQKTQITLGLTFTKDTPNVKALLIMLPDKFIHDVLTPTDVQNLNKRFPVASGSEWADTQFADRIKIALDESAGGAVVKADTYQFSFPALVPPTMSKTNIWSISLCHDRLCSQANDKYVIVSFPIAGFDLYEMAPEVLRVTTNFGLRSAQMGAGVFAALLATLSPLFFAAL
eukprot:TRINITY_DN90538_c0_g1_i1.p1 TRINITY_DN90538_c0_g1~~TRINITY_DN90538_c0_g1_i1.p1  ORF type:complete len:3212 (+),score=723.49 TRINITY_DN90538_c0_g1_i1:26-9637(+)